MALTDQKARFFSNLARLLLPALFWALPAQAQPDSGPAWTGFLAGLALEYRLPPEAAGAREHYLAAARAGSREALLGLARLHGPGSPLWQGPDLWRDHLLAAARAGWAEAAFILAEALEKKTLSGLEPTPFYIQAAAAGHPAAAYRLAALYDEGAGGLPRDPGQALLWLTVAASRDDQNAALELGRYYYQQNPEEAAVWLEKSGTPEAMYWLGEINLRNRRFPEAMEALTQAAEAGRLEAHLALGLLNLDNDFGRRPDPRAALRHFKTAADLPEGAYQLGRMFLAGQATPKDPITGAFWLRQAAEKGHERARAEYDKLGLTLTPGQQKRLDRMIEEGLAPTTRTKPEAGSK
jgi:TPR repeat protein